MSQPAVRLQPHAGDLFRVRGRRLVGRVVSTTAVVGPTHGCLLIYVYADGRLSRESLLVPPMLTTRAPFSHGLFEPLRREPVAGHALARHVFRDGAGHLLDEEGRPVAALSDLPAGTPVGEYRLLGVEAIEAMLSASPADYDAPEPASAHGLDTTEAVRQLFARWTAAFGRPPTREEWLALYDVASEGVEAPPS